jgi:hypothetical protein
MERCIYFRRSRLVRELLPISFIREEASGPTFAKVETQVKLLYTEACLVFIKEGQEEV